MTEREKLGLPYAVVEKPTSIGRCYVVDDADKVGRPHGGVCLYDDDTSLNPHGDGEQKARAAFIVRACNTFHKALEALKAVERRMAHFTEHALFADSVAKEAIAHECNSLRGAASRAIAEMED